MLGPFVTAFRTLTLLPVPGKETHAFPLSIIGFPLVGLFLGAIVWTFFQGIRLWDVQMIPLLVVSALATESLLTGALHLDGLGDCADAFPGKRNRQQILHILKDSRMGTFGVCAVVFDLLFKYVLWGILFQHTRIMTIVISLILSRTMQGCCLVMVPNAGEEGIASAFAGNHSPRYKLLMIVILAVVSAFSIIFSASWIAGAASLLSAAFVTLLWVRYCRKKIGGITGDCLGALNEFVEVAVLLSAGILPTS